MKDSGKKGILGLGIGVAVGTVLTALFTPKNGKEMRAEVKDKAVKAKEKAGDVKDAAADKAGKAKDKLSEMKDSATDKTKSSKKSAKK